MVFEAIMLFCEFCFVCFFEWVDYPFLLDLALVIIIFLSYFFIPKICDRIAWSIAKAILGRDIDTRNWPYEPE
jgi:hypothetical protein